MAQTFRASKTAGTNQYQTEVAAGALAILDTEVDEDFNRLYATINALDNANFNPAGPKLVYEKLDLVGRIVNTDVKSTANIALTKLNLTGTGGTIPGTAIAPSAITKDKISKTHTVQDEVSVGTETDFAWPNTTVELLLDEAVWTSRGSFWIGFGMAAGQYPVGVAGAQSIQTLTFRLRIDGTAGLPDGVLLQESRYVFGSGAATMGGPYEHYFPVSAAVMHFGALLPVANHRVKFTGQCTLPISFAGHPPILSTHRLAVLEFA
jgi:hypothetical protein